MKSLKDFQFPGKNLVMTALVILAVLLIPLWFVNTSVSQRLIPWISVAIDLCGIYMLVWIVIKREAKDYAWVMLQIVFALLLVTLIGFGIF